MTHLRRNDGIDPAPCTDVVHFDPDMYGVDVMENVFRGVQVLTDSTRSFSGEVIDRNLREWLVGTTISTVRITVLRTDD